MTAKELVEQFFIRGYVEQDYEFVLRSFSENYVDYNPA